MLTSDHTVRLYGERRSLECSSHRSRMQALIVVLFSRRRGNIAANMPQPIAEVLLQGARLAPARRGTMRASGAGTSCEPGQAGLDGSSTWPRRRHARRRVHGKAVESSIWIPKCFLVTASTKR